MWGGGVREGRGYTFLALHSERVKHTPSNDANLPPVRSEEVALVQIDAPASASARAWNAAIRREVAMAQTDEAGAPDAFAHDGPGYASIRVELASASAEAISARLIASDYSGGAHPNTTSTTLLWSMPLARALTAADLCATPRSPALQRLVSARYNAASGQGHQGCDEPVVATSKLTVDRGGITFVFDPYDQGAYTCAGASAVSWAALGPYLRAPLPFRPETLRSPPP